MQLQIIEGTLEGRREKECQTQEVSFVNVQSSPNDVRLHINCILNEELKMPNMKVF